MLLGGGDGRIFFLDFLSVGGVKWYSVTSLRLKLLSEHERCENYRRSCFTREQNY